MIRRTRWALALALAMLAPPARGDDSSHSFVLQLRDHTETAKGAGRYHVRTSPTTWDAKKTAVVICDMWDKHWCPGATARVAEMAPRMNEVIVAARKRGSLIIHCPSDTMTYYKDAPGRKLAQAAPKVEAKVPLQGWCKLDPKHEPPLPIDDSEGGCAEASGKGYRAWSHEIDTLKIEPGDAITDNAEAYYLMRQRGIENVLVMGVHTNMCVLGRPFAIRQLVMQGLNVALVRDMTDTMYDPARRPFVSHFTGTDLVVEHIEKYWCPTVTSSDIVGGKPFRFQDDRRPNLVMVIGENEYKTEQTLPAFALQELGKAFRVSYVFAAEKDPNEFPGIDVLRDADVVLLSIRRRALPEKELAIVRQYIASGKPLVGIRTACHSFALAKGQKLPAGHAEWKDFDKEILGCNYHMHHKADLKTFVKAIPSAAGNPILSGVSKEEFPVASSLYKTLPLAESATPLLLGRVDSEIPEPVAWTFQRKDGGRVFFTTLGHVGDFKNPNFVRLLKNGIHWAAALPIPKS